MARMVPFSVLDLVAVAEGATPGDALRDSLDLARHAERLGFNRFWVAEHHNMPGIASAATAVVIGHLAAGTSTIRVGAGGVMLPNHSPLVIAEQFGTLESLHPGRIDLGLGRAPGADMRTFAAMRRDPNASEEFPRDVQELQALLAPVRPNQVLQAVPGGGTEVPLWILGSSLFGAQLAGLLGLPYAFASHFAPAALLQALETYRSTFRPSAQLDQPHAMVAVNVFAADTDAEGTRLFTTLQQAFTNLRRGRPGKYQPPIDDIDKFWSPMEKAQAEQMLALSVVGSRETVDAGLREVVAATQADELMVVSAIHDHAARVHSYEIVAEIADAWQRETLLCDQTN
ncbi:MAG: luciferase family protein [Ilumatobacteraceae bacterium]|nr:luciferase family protein [Ilumatobacteraceae bacterium]